MVPARNLQLLRDAHGTPFIRDVAAGVNALTAQPPTPSHHMAQEPINQDPSKPPPPQERQQVHQEERHGEALAVLPPPPQQQPHPPGTSGSSSGGSSSNGGGGAGGGDWLRLGLGPASPDPGATAPEIDLFAGTAGPRQELLQGMGMPPGAFLRPAMPGIPQASLQMSVPRAGPPWLPPWSHAAQQPQLLLPFGHRGLYGPGSPAAGPSGFDTTRVVLPPPAATANAGVWFVFQAAPHQGREPFLPQIPRSYLRIKDGRVTVRLLIKYLANKLGLEDESEVRGVCLGWHIIPSPLDKNSSIRERDAKRD
ncbi:trithorax group protein osa-like [Hordeum vulgare]|nr:trithorax group protein osa-like [Hordeum vulgare]